MVNTRAGTPTTGRRGLLRRVLLGAGGAAGVGLVGAAPARANAGGADVGDFNVLTVGEILTVGQPAGPQLLFAGNSGAGITVTGPPSPDNDAVDAALRVRAADGEGIVVTSGGPGLVIGNPGGVAAEIDGTTSMTTGTSNGTVLEVSNAGTADAVSVRAGTGRGIVVSSGGGPQINLHPGQSAGHPQTGQPGDFYVDAHVRLWFCRGGHNWRLVA